MAACIIRVANSIASGNGGHVEPNLKLNLSDGESRCACERHLASVLHQLRFPQSHAHLPTPCLSLGPLHFRDSQWHKSQAETVKGGRIQDRLTKRTICRKA